ncbi:ricin-type beta-trefoil lectin domain protein [Streptomyces sp. NPDC003691]
MPSEPDNRSSEQPEASEPSRPSDSSETFEPFKPSKPFKPSQRFEPSDRLETSDRLEPSDRLDLAELFDTRPEFGSPLPVPPGTDAGPGPEELDPLVGADTRERRSGPRPGKRGWIAIASAAALTGLVLVAVPLMNKEGSGSGPAKSTSAAGDQEEWGSGGPGGVDGPEGGEGGDAQAEGGTKERTTSGTSEPGRKSGASPGKGSGSGPGGSVSGSGAASGSGGATAGKPAAGSAGKAEKPQGVKAPQGPAKGGGTEIPRPPKLDDGKVKGPVMGFAANLCMDIAGSDVTDGTPLRLDDCSGKARQRFEFRPDGKVWTLYQRKTCMDVSGGGTADGTPLQIADCSANPAQTFRLQTDGSLVNPQSGKCVEPVNLGGSTGFRLQLQTCDGSRNQKWQIG